MTTPSRPVSRRTVLRAAGVAATIGVAGCLSGRDRPANVTLDPPENYDKLVEADLPYPIYGEKLPAVTVPGVVHDRPVSTREFVGERHLLLTFVYTRCDGICLNLGQNLVHVQAHAADAGFTDEIAVAGISFDPEHDTPTRLRTWGAKRGLEYDLGNCYLLRPESPTRARTVVEDTFGEAYKHEEGAEMPFLHSGLILLVNDEGVVERSYAGDPPNPTTVLDDVEALVGV
nr:SCO family protein [Haloferax larsenii]